MIDLKSEDSTRRINHPDFTSGHKTGKIIARISSQLAYYLVLYFILFCCLVCVTSYRTTLAAYKAATQLYTRYLKSRVRNQQRSTNGGTSYFSILSTMQTYARWLINLLCTMSTITLFKPTRNHSTGYVAKDKQKGKEKKRLRRRQRRLAAAQNCAGAAIDHKLDINEKPVERDFDWALIHQARIVMKQIELKE